MVAAYIVLVTSSGFCNLKARQPLRGAKVTAGKTPWLKPPLKPLNLNSFEELRINHYSKPIWHLAAVSTPFEIHAGLIQR